MSQPFKLRYQNEIVGVFLLGATVSMMVVALMLARGGSAGDADDMFECAIEFEELGVGPLAPGLSVRLRSQRVGRVLRSDFAGRGKQRATVALAGTLRDAIPTDSVAVLYTPMAGLAGETYLEIAPGVAETYVDVGGAMKGRVAGDVLQLATDLLVELHGNVAPALIGLTRVSNRVDGAMGRVEAILDLPENQSSTEALVARAGEAAARAERTLTKVEALLDRLDGTINKVDRAIGLAEGALSSTGRLLGKVERGEGLVGRALQDDALERKVVGLLDKMATLVATFDRVVARSSGAIDAAPHMMAEARTALADMAVVAAELRRLAPAVPAMVGQIDELLGEGRAALDAASRHWLVGSAMRPAGPPMPLPAVGLRDQAPLPELEALRRALAPVRTGTKVAP